jgi:hypothetical protein
MLSQLRVVEDSGLVGGAVDRNVAVLLRLAETLRDLKAP